MTKARFKQTTAGHCALRWFRTEAKATAFSTGLDAISVYVGRWDRMPDRLAKKLATIHPSFAKYYADAMMPLWKLQGTNDEYGTIENGSESPQLALAWGIKDTHPWVVVWQVFTDTEDEA